MNPKCDDCPYKTTECYMQCQPQQRVKPPQRTKLNPVSKKRAGENAEYLKLKAQFLKDNPRCAVYPTKASTDVHHRRGRIGALLTDTRYFLAVSMAGHRWIEEHPQEAYEKGWSLQRFEKKETV